MKEKNDTAKSKWLVWAQRIAPIALIAFVVWYFPKLDWHEIKNAFLQAKLRWILLGVGLTVCFWISRSLLLWFILKEKQAVLWKTCWAATVVGMLGDAVIPGRAGQLIRWGILVTRTELAKSYVAFSMVAFVVLEATGLLIYSISASLVHFSAESEPGLISLPVLFGFTGVLMGILTVIYCSPFLAKALASSRFSSTKILNNLLEILHLARKPRRLAGWIGGALAIWTIQIGILFASAEAIGISMTFSQLVFVLLGINLGIAIPLIPGNLGSFQLIIVYLMKSLGFEAEPALALALLYHSTHLLPLIIFGSAVALFFGYGRSELKKFKNQEKASEAA